ncbi:hypothetical protein [Streptomyces sp. TRM70350]|uniref:hypothetical protein n=1 Tax=Streptomyces sp. TRM70350 TaxID=2856165 RepID=UPI001C48E2E8|nr:hypothetical protein [Streptomyces sp. TRM70350]MBV7695823.1 hypothetical protein [Streptomyces sp. TRM70350]
MAATTARGSWCCGKYAMVPLGFSYRQQIVQQAPKGFDRQVLPEFKESSQHVLSASADAG